MRGKRISTDQKKQILALRQQGLAIKQITRDMGVSYLTARHWADADNHVSLLMDSELQNKRQLTGFEKMVMSELARASAWPVKDLHREILPHLFERTRQSESAPSERSIRRVIAPLGFAKYLKGRDDIEVGTVGVHLVSVTWEEKHYLTAEYVRKKGHIMILMERHTGFIHLVRINAMSPDFLLAQLQRVINRLSSEFRLAVKTIRFVTYMNDGITRSTALDMDLAAARELLGLLDCQVEFDLPTRIGPPGYLGRFIVKADLGRLIRKEEYNYNFRNTSFEFSSGVFLGATRVNARLQAHLQGILKRERNESLHRATYGINEER